MRSTPRVVQTSITIGEPVGAENLTSACEMVGMMAIVIMAMSAAQTPTCSTTRDKLRYELPNGPNGWFLVRRTA
jgi:peroxiredoxin